MICGVGCRHGSDPALLWLWCRPAAVAPIPPLAWESPYAMEAALEKAKRQKKKKRKEKAPFILLIYPHMFSTLFQETCYFGPFKFYLAFMPI